MTIYLVLVIINIVLLLLPQKAIKFNGKKQKIQYAAVVCILMFIIMGFRDYSVGIDTYPYQRAYSQIAGAFSFRDAIKITTFTGPGYVLLCWLLHYISKDPRLCEIVIALIINVLLYKCACREKNGLKYTLLWQTMYLFAFSLNGNRQVLATLIHINALEILNIKNLKGWLLVALGVSIHPTSILLPLIYIVSRIIAAKFDLKKLSVVAIISGIIASSLLKAIVSFFLRFMTSYEKYMNGTVIRSFFNDIGGGKIIFFYLFIMLVLMAFALFISRRNEKVMSEKKWRFFAVIFAATLGILNSKNTTIFRIFMYIIPLGIPLFTEVKLYIKGKSRLLIEVGFNMILLAYMILNLIDNQSGVVPYMFGV